MAVAFLAARPSPTTHLMVAAELFAGARDKNEQKQIESFLRSFVVVSPDESDGPASLELFKEYRLSHGVDWPDCQIAATALRLRMQVDTLNLKHFAAFPGLSAVQPY